MVVPAAEWAGRVGLAELEGKAKAKHEAKWRAESPGRGARVPLAVRLLWSMGGM